MAEVHLARGRVRGGCLSRRAFLYQGAHELGVGEDGEEGVGFGVRKGRREGGEEAGRYEEVMMSYPTQKEKDEPKYVAFSVRAIGFAYLFYFLENRSLATWQALFRHLFVEGQPRRKPVPLHIVPMDYFHFLGGEQAGRKCRPASISLFPFSCHKPPA